MFLLASTTVHVSTAILAVVSGVIIPFLAATLSKEKAAAWIVNTLQAVLVAVTGTVSVAASNNGNLDWKAALGSILLTAVTVVVTNFLPGAKPAIASVRRKTASFGLG